MFEKGQAVRAAAAISGSEFQVARGTLGFVVSKTAGGFFSSSRHCVRFVGETGIVQANDLLERSLKVAEDGFVVPTNVYDWLLMRPESAPD